MAAIASNGVERINFIAPHALENLVKLNSIRIMRDELCKCLRRTLVGTPLPLGERVDDIMDSDSASMSAFKSATISFGPNAATIFVKTASIS